MREIEIRAECEKIVECKDDKKDRRDRWMRRIIFYVIRWRVDKHEKWCDKFST